MGTANEILQIDAGWCKIETLVASRKVKMVKRVMSKDQGAIVRRILEKAALQRTEWTKEAETLMKEKVVNVRRHKWGRINEIVRRLKHTDLMDQLDRLQRD